jgi:hypothetical protein
MSVGGSKVREEIRNCFSVYVVLVNVGFPKKKKIKLIAMIG